MINFCISVRGNEPENLYRKNELEKLDLHGQFVEYRFNENAKVSSVEALQKSNAIAFQLRSEGNASFEFGDYVRAFELYNRSASNAEPNSELLGLAYANRSAVLFEMKMYGPCLANIELARESKYPRRLYAKLEEREKKCREAMKKEPTDLKIEELRYGPHPTVPFITNHLEIRDKKGIHTTKALQPGDLVAVDEPFSAFLNPEQIPTNCWNCCKISYASIPCDTCVYPLFCNKECREKGFAIHKHECPIIVKTLESEDSEFLYRFAIRMFFTAMSLFESADEFQQFCENPDNQKDNIFEMNKENFDRREYFKLICGTDSIKNDPNVRLPFLYAALAKKVILEFTDLKTVFLTDRHRRFLGEILLHFAKIAQSREYNYSKPTFGSRIYGLSKYLRHSCEPNVVRINSGAKSLIFVVRPIAPNEELFENYWEMDQSWISVKKWKCLSRETFKFTCSCKRCKFDRTYNFYNWIHPRVPNQQITLDFQSIETFDKKYAEMNYKRFAEFIKNHAKYPYSSQVTRATFCLKKCLELIFKFDIHNL